jgi:citrate synthase
MNGDIVKNSTEEGILTAPVQIAQLAPTDAKAVETAYLVVLSRMPTPEEAAHFTARLAGTRSTERNHALEDLYWTLVNSTEFSWNH